MSENNKSVRLIDFWAAWCGPCKIMHPIIEEIEQEYKDKIVVDKYNVDEESNQAKVQQYQIMSMPTYLIEKDGEIVQQLIGAQPKSTITDAIDKALSS